MRAVKSQMGTTTIGSFLRCRCPEKKWREPLMACSFFMRRCNRWLNFLPEALTTNVVGETGRAPLGWILAALLACYPCSFGVNGPAIKITLYFSRTEISIA